MSTRGVLGGESGDVLYGRGHVVEELVLLFAGELVGGRERHPRPVGGFFRFRGDGGVDHPFELVFHEVTSGFAMRAS